MVELMSSIISFVNERTDNAGRNINEDFFSADSGDEIMCRHDVSPKVARRYMTGSYWAEFNFSFYSRASDPITARQVLEEIEAALFIDNFIDLLGMKNGRVIVVSCPHPVSKDEAGNVIYTSSYKLEYFQEV